MTERVLTLADIELTHPEDMAWMREHCEGTWRLGPQHIEPGTLFRLDETIEQSVGVRYRYRSIDGEVMIEVGGQGEPIIAAESD